MRTTFQPSVNKNLNSSPRKGKKSSPRKSPNSVTRKSRTSSTNKKMPKPANRRSTRVTRSMDVDYKESDDSEVTDSEGSDSDDIQVDDVINGSDVMDDAGISRLSFDLSDASIRSPSSGKIYPQIFMKDGKSKSKKKSRSPLIQGESACPESYYEDDLSSSFGQTPAQLVHMNTNNSGSWYSFYQGIDNRFFFFFFVLLMALMVYKAANMFSHSSMQGLGRDPDVVLEEWKTQVANLKHKYPAQSQHTWKIVSSSLREQLRSTAKGDLPTYPSVILIASNSSSRTISCLANSLGRHLTSLQLWQNADCPEINLSTWKDSLSGKVKLELDESTRRHYDLGTRCIRLSHLGHIPAEGAKMLHALCDGHNPQYRDLVIIMTLEMTSDNPLPTFHSDNVKNSAFWTSIDGLIETRLKSVWEKDLGVEEMAAVLSRVANNIVAITEESQTALETACLT